MPKSTKLHAKGKSSSLQKPCNVPVADTTEGNDPDEVARQFQLELCWCIQQLETSLTDKKVNEKQLQETWKVLTVLKNNNQPIIRKRQLMRTHFGDYRAKMAAEEKKLAKLTSKIKITDSPANPKAKFLRKSIFSSTGDSSFRFDFELGPDKLDENIAKKLEENNAALDKETHETATEGSVKINENDSVLPKDKRPFKFTFTGSQFKFNFSNEINS